MKLFEYQAKDLFASAGIPVPKRRLLESAADLDAAISEVGFPCVLKAQVLQGGRGKAGLIQFVKNPTEAAEKAQMLWASPAGVKKLLVEEALQIQQELYLAVTVDPASGSPLVIASSQGGVEIEELAKSAPGQIVRERVNIFTGLQGFQTKEIAYRLNLPAELIGPFAKVLMSLYQLFTQRDAELAEINPLIVTADGHIVAADGKFSIDDSALFRQPGYSMTREHFTSDLEYEAAVAGIPYLQFDGDIGIMCAGAGLTNTIYDLIHYYGGSPANYLEFGGPNYHRAMEAMTLALKNKPKVLLIVTFGTIARADVMAKGIAEAIANLQPDIPIVTAIRGTGEDEAAAILREIGLEPLQDTEEAVQRAVALAARGRD